MSDLLGYAGDPRSLSQTLYELIEMADESVVLQMYLFAADGHLATVRPRPGAFPHAETVAAWLLDKRRRRPDVTVAVLLDTNTPDDPRLVRRPGDLVRHRLERAGIPVLNANLFHNRFDRARTFPPALAFHREWPREGSADWVARQQRWQSLHNVEDHRKNLVIDGGRWAAVTSHNLIDAAADWHENLFVFDGAAARRVSDLALAALGRALEIPQRIDDRQRSALRALSTRDPAIPSGPYQHRPPAPGLAGFAPPRTPFARPVTLRRAPVRVLDGGEIRGRYEAAIDSAGRGDEVALASAYFSDLPTWRRLVRAAGRGARVRVLVDDVAGLPLGAVTGALVRGLVNRRFLDEAAARPVPGVEVRVHRSGGGRMMHLKTLVVRGASPVVIGGQANVTPNSFSGAWCETDVEVADADVVETVLAHFDALWSLPESRPLPPAGPLAGPLRLASRGVLGLFAAAGIRP